MNKVVIVGVNGVVGRVLLEVLAPLGLDLVVLGRRSSGETIDVGGRQYVVENSESYDFSEVDGAFLCVSPESVPGFCHRIKRGWIIEGSGEVGANVVVPEIYKGGVGRIVTSPNCVAIGLSLLLYALQLDVLEVWGSTYQSVSGAGNQAMQDLRVRKGVYNNLQPDIEGESERIQMDVRKVLNVRIPIQLLTVRVPVEYGHGMHLRIMLGKTVTKGEVVEKLLACPYICYEEGAIPVPLDVIQSSKVHVGCLQVEGNVLDLWVVIDNVYRGAAWNMYAIAKRFFGLGEKHE